jgi:putative OPT family oligopeptide transporter
MAEVLTPGSVDIVDEVHVPVAESVVVHEPFIPSSVVLPEFSLRAVAVGSILGVIFGASSVYLALKVGLTVSASIPIAVMSISIFRAFGRASILENNVAQTAGSAGESIAAGVVFTIPALLILGYDLEITRTTMIALLGGWLGVLLMIPLRRALIVKEHGKLVYPEGTACAEVLIAGEKGGTDAKMVFAGLGIGALYKILNVGAKLWKDIPDYVLKKYQNAVVAAEISPELLGVGFIIGPRIAALMVGGGVLSALVLIPIVKFFGSGYTTPLFPATSPDELIRAMSSGQIQDRYIRYIAAGAVATGGIISLCRTLPTIVGAFRSSLGSFNAKTSIVSSENGVARRTDRDMSSRFVLFGIIVLSIAIFIWLVVAGAPASGIVMNILSVLLVLVFGFFFATVSSRITGEIGSSSNPISGMTIATILLTSLIFLLLGKAGADSRVLALSVGAVVCIAASNAGTTSQDLKTGFLVGGTPAKMQWALMVGVTTSALLIAWTLTFLDYSRTNLLPRNYPSYHAQTHEEAWTKGDAHGGPLNTKQPLFVHRIAVDEKLADQSIIPAGRYLVDQSGAVHYMINAGVGGLKQEVTNTKLPTTPFVAGDNVEFKTEKGRGMDDELYRIALVKGQEGNKTYLVDDSGVAKYEVANTSATSKFDAPKAQLMAVLVDGVLTQKLPWSLILIGAFISILLEIVGVSALPFAVGMYLPLSTSATIFAGGGVRFLVERTSRGKRTMAEEESGPGVLFSSGLIAGGAIAGLLLAIPAAFELDEKLAIGRYLPAVITDNNIVALITFGVLCLGLYRVAMRRSSA